MFATKEQTSARYSAIVKDELGNVVPGSTLTSLKLTVYDVDSATKLNSRDAQNVLNTNGVTVDESGNLVWVLAPADNAIVNAAKPVERHRAVFEFTWGTGKRGWHRVDLEVTGEKAVV